MAPLGTANEPRNAAGAQDQPVIGPLPRRSTICPMCGCNDALGEISWDTDRERERERGDTSGTCLMSFRAIVYDRRGDEGWIVRGWPIRNTPNGGRSTNVVVLALLRFFFFFFFFFLNRIEHGLETIVWKYIYFSILIFYMVKLFLYLFIVVVVTQRVT